MSARPRDAGPPDARSPRVLHVITGLGAGGAEHTLVSLAVSLRSTGQPVAVAALAADGPNRARLEAAGVVVHDLAMRRDRVDPIAALRLARIIRATRPAIVQGWMYHADLLALVGLWLSGRRSVTRLVWSIRCSDMDARRYGALFRATLGAWKAFSGRADAVIANSDAGIATHRAMGCRFRTVIRIDNGVEIDRFRPDLEARDRVRRDLGIAVDESVVAIVGRVDPMKGFDRFLRVVDRLPGVRMLAIGLGTEALPTRPNLLSLGYRDDVPRLLAASDLLLSTSSFGEGFPNVVLEAMSSGIPVVATDVGDTRRIVADTGRVVPVDDEERLIAAIRSLSSDAALRQRLGRAARQRVEEQFTLPKMVRAYESAHDAILRD